MSDIDNPEEHNLEVLLDELGLSLDESDAIETSAEEDIASVFYAEGYSHGQLDARQTNIVDRSQRWIRFLCEQAEHLTDAAASLYDQLTALSSPASAWLSEVDEGARPAIIDRLEWTLSAFETSIEERQPNAESRQFRIRWTGDDGVALWEGEDDTAEPASVRDLALDGAEVEGGFPPKLAFHIATLIVAGLRSGTLRLLRVRPVEGESGGEARETVFEMLPRGEAYLAEIASAGESPLVSPDVEVALSEGKGARLASLLDATSYRAARAAAGASPDPGAEAKVVGRVSRIADACGIPKADALRCLLSVASVQLDEAVRGNHQAAARRLVRTVTDLAGAALSERRT